MPFRLRTATGHARLAGLCLLIALAGCEPAAPLEGAGLTLSPPSGWMPTASAPPVPGSVLAAWSGPVGATLVAYRTLPASGATAESLAEGLANRLRNLPGVRDLIRRTIQVAGREAAWVGLVAAGTGGALAPTGTGTPSLPEGQAEIPTREVSVGLPDPAGPLWLCWRYPESAGDRIGPQVEATLKTVRHDPRALATSSY